ncbi:uncharacterized protein METZ01_LOCUS384566 [marine metagenome]|uniref:Uncharacterized protein n=1 Tax=marine metagenome TaxID=408172 RepID=A0A382UC99_9ZZZZ
MSGTDELSILLGDAGGLESSGYTACAITTIHNTASAGDDASGRFVLAAAQGASDVVDGVVILMLEDSSAYTWALSSSCRIGSNRIATAGGSKSLSAELTQVNIYTGGSDTFDAGAVNITYF